MYVKTICKADLPKADRYYLEIQGANSSAEVFVGGESLAVHHGGYSTWRVDLTDKLADETQIAVLVNNAANETVYPQMADFTFYGGIYRDVNIICVSEAHFDLDYYGGSGLQVAFLVLKFPTRICKLHSALQSALFLLLRVFNKCLEKAKLQSNCGVTRV